jgi:hypothetical protein
MKILKIITVTVALIFFSNSYAKHETNYFSEKTGDIVRFSAITDRFNDGTDIVNSTPLGGTTEITTTLINCKTLKTATSPTKIIKGSGRSDELLKDLSFFTSYPPKFYKDGGIWMRDFGSVFLGDQDTKRYQDLCRSLVSKDPKEELSKNSINIVWSTMEENYKKWETNGESKKALDKYSANEKKEKDNQAKADAEAEAKLIKEFPYIAKFTCTVRGAEVNFLSCLYGRGSLKSEIEITNGNEYKKYDGAEFSWIAKDGDDGSKILNLKSKFSITAQNAASDLILSLKIINRKNGKVIYEKNVSQYGVIKIKN